jgi:hypothetical protein
MLLRLGHWLVLSDVDSSLVIGLSDDLEGRGKVQVSAPRAVRKRKVSNSKNGPHFMRWHGRRRGGWARSRPWADGDLKVEACLGHESLVWCQILERGGCESE